MTTPETLYAECERYLRRKAADNAVSRFAEDKRPVVELVLTGVLPFDRSVLEMARIETMVEEHFHPLTAQVKNMTQATEFAISPDARLNRAELERQIMVELLERDARYRDRSEVWAKLAMSLKDLAIDGADAKTIVDEVAGALKPNQSKDAE